MSSVDSMSNIGSTGNEYLKRQMQCRGSATDIVKHVALHLTNLYNMLLHFVHITEAGHNVLGTTGSV